MSTLEPTSKREPLLHLLAKHHLPELQFERWLPPANEDRAWTSTPLRITEEALHELSIYDSLELEPSTRNSIHECIEDALPFLNLDDSPNEEQGGQSYHDVMRWMENETRTAKHLHKLSGHSGGAFFFVSSHLAEPVTHVANLVLSGANGRLVTSPENIDKALMIIKLSWTEDSLRTFTELPPRRPLLLLMFRSNEEVPPEEVDSLIRDLGSGAIGVGQDGSAYMMGSPDQPRHERPEKCRVLDQLRMCIRRSDVPFVGLCNGDSITIASVTKTEESCQFTFRQPVKLNGVPSADNLAASPLGLLLGVSIKALIDTGIISPYGQARVQDESVASDTEWVLVNAQECQSQDQADQPSVPQVSLTTLVSHKPIDRHFGQGSRPLRFLPRDWQEGSSTSATEGSLASAMESNSTSPLQVHLGAKLGRGSVWTAYDATLQLPDGSRITGLVWKERVPAYVPTKHWKAAKEHAIETELRMVNGPLAPLLGRTVPEVYGVWTSPGGFAHAVLMENAGPMVTAEEIEDPLVRTAMAKAIDDVLEVGVNQVDWGWRHIRLRRAGDSLKVMLIDFDQACELGREYSKIELAEFRDEVLRDLDKEVAEEHKQQRMIKEWAEKRALRRAKKLVK